MKELIGMTLRFTGGRMSGRYPLPAMIACGAVTCPSRVFRTTWRPSVMPRHLAELVDRRARRLGLPRERPCIGQRVQVPAAPVHHAAGVERRFHQLGERGAVHHLDREPVAPVEEVRLRLQLRDGGPVVFGEGRAGAVGGLRRVGRAEVAQLPARVLGKVPERAGAAFSQFRLEIPLGLVEAEVHLPAIAPRRAEAHAMGIEHHDAAARPRQRQRGPKPGEPGPEDRHIRGDIALQRRAFGVRRQARGIPGRGVFAGLVVAIERRHDAGSDVHQQVLALPGGDHLQKLAVFQRFHAV
jgi:hypothetical protein